MTYKVIDSLVTITSNKEGHLKIESDLPQWAKELEFDTVVKKTNNEVNASIHGSKSHKIFTANLVQNLFGYNCKQGLLYHLVGETSAFVLSSIRTDESGTELKFIPKTVSDYIHEAKMAVVEEGVEGITYAWEI